MEIASNLWGIPVTHPIIFQPIWMLVHHFHLDEQTEDDIVWKHTSNGHLGGLCLHGIIIGYGSFSHGWNGLDSLDHPFLINNFGYDYLINWWFKIGYGPPIGWSNVGIQIVDFIPFVSETRVWDTSVSSSSISSILLSLGIWRRPSRTGGLIGPMASLKISISWTVWSERNVQVFCHKCAPQPILLNIIIANAKLWNFGSPQEPKI